MSLIHWWPLNGNLNDYGVGASATISGTASYGTSGKIGASCLNTSNTIQFTDSKFNGVRVWSICFWGYVISSSVVNNWTGLFHITDGSSSVRVEVCPSTYSSGKYCYSIHNNSGNAIFNSSIVAPTGGFYDQWTHFAITCDGSYISTYANGVKLGTLSYTGTGTITGTFKLLNNHIVKKNDFRIYDQALSQKEVKEISKGLVLHYNFENACNPNLLINSGNYTVTNKATSSLANKDGVKHWPIYFNSLQDNTTYTLSVDFDGTLSATHKTDGSANPADRLCAVWLYFRTNPYSDSDYSSYDKPIIFTSANYNHKQISPTRHQWTFTLGSAPAYYACCAIRTNTYSDGSTPVVVNFWDFKLEKSDTSTPFISNTTIDSIIYDTSGYGNNGTIVGNPQIVADAASGLRSIKFDGASAVRTSNFFLGNEWSYGCWVKSAASSRSWEGVIIQNTNGGDADMQLGFYTYPGSGNRLQSTANGQYNSSITYTYDNTWKHLFATFDGANLKTYINGQLINTKSITNAWLARNMLTIGARYRGGTSYDCYFAGNIDDVKIYSTVLSDSDILAEYNRKASIDRNGNLFTGEFVANNSKTNISKTGIVESSHFEEGTSLVKMVDGYTELEYIGSTGTQYINTAVPVADDFEFVLDQMSNLDTGNHYLCGSSTSGRMLGTLSNRLWSNAVVASGIAVGKEVRQTIGCHIIANGSSGSDYVMTNYTLGTSQSGHSSYSTSSSSNTVCLFRVNGMSSSESFTCYDFKVFSLGVMVAHLIPAKRNKDNVIGMYDIVNRVFYTNSGTGTFTAGPEKGNLSIVYSNELKEC